MSSVTNSMVSRKLSVVSRVVSLRMVMDTHSLVSPGLHVSTSDRGRKSVLAVER